MFGVAVYKISGPNRDVSSGSGSFTVTGSTLTEVVKFTNPIWVTAGRGVKLYLNGLGSGGASYIVISTAGGDNAGVFQFRRDTRSDFATETTIQTIYLGVSAFVLSGGITITAQANNFPPGVVSHIDRPSAGNYYYRLMASGFTGAQTVGVQDCVLIADEDA